MIDIVERIDNAIENMVGDASCQRLRWVLPNGQNALIASPAGNLIAVHANSLLEWAETMRRAGAALRAERAEVARMRDALVGVVESFDADVGLRGADVERMRAMAVVDSEDGGGE